MRPLLLVLGALVLAMPAAAHQPSDAFLTLDVMEERVSGRLDLALRDLDHALGLDLDQDRRLDWAEVRSRQDEIAAYALTRLDLVSDAGRCRPELDRLLIDRHVGDVYAVLAFGAACPSPPDWLEVRYRLLFDLDPSHRGLLRVTWDGETSDAVLAPDADSWRVGRGGPGAVDVLARFVPAGVHHLLIGVDHILFLLVLLLPLGARTDWRLVVRDVVGMVTAFTAAHSVTLALAAFEIVRLPAALVESGIALSLVLAALNNLVPLLGGRIWAIAFAFGLVHGLGFASVFAELGPPDPLALLGFNLGVELGQLLIVAAFLPVLRAVQWLTVRPELVMRAGSGAVAIAGLLWLIEHAAPVSLMNGLIPLARAF